MTAVLYQPFWCRGPRQHSPCCDNLQQNWLCYLSLMLIIADIKNILSPWCILGNLRQKRQAAPWKPLPYDVLLWLSLQSLVLFRFITCFCVSFVLFNISFFCFNKRSFTLERKQLSTDIFFSDFSKVKFEPTVESTFI